MSASMAASVKESEQKCKRECGSDVILHAREKRQKQKH